jgi:dGTPase
MYRHWKVNRMTGKARRLTEALFAVLHDDPDTLPAGWRAQAGEGEPARAAAVVCDYVAGMTDRFAMEEYKRLTDLALPG